LGAHWRHLKNTTEPPTCGGDAALCQITLTTCFLHGATLTAVNERHSLYYERLVRDRRQTLLVSEGDVSS